MAELTRKDFIRVLVRDGMSEKNALLIMRNAATVQRISIVQCNQPVTDATLKRSDRAQKRIENICAEYKGFTPTFCGDPRGHVTSITVPSGEYNYLGGSMAVPHNVR